MSGLVIFISLQRLVVEQAETIRALREALEPFARYAVILNGKRAAHDGTQDEYVWRDNHTINAGMVGPDKRWITAGDYRKAAEALANSATESTKEKK